MTDPKEGCDADVPSYYRNSLGGTTFLYLFLWKNSVPKGIATDMLRTCSGNGYVFLCWGNMLFNPNLMERPYFIIVQHPSQVGCLFLEYPEDVTFYYNILGFI